MTTLDIIIVNYNGGDALQQCLDSIPSAATEDLRIRVRIVDNASTDRSIENLTPIGLPVDVIVNEKNLGFARACNRGAKASDAELLLFLNPDTRLFSDSLAQPVRVLMDDPSIGMLSIRLEDACGNTQRTCARFLTALHLLCQTFYISRLHPTPRTSHRMLEWDHLCTRRVDHVMGAFMLMRREVYRQLGGLDERFFMYLEDMDLSLRLHQAGYQSLYYAGAHCYHASGGTSSQVPVRRLYYSLLSRLQYADKHFSLGARVAAYTTTLLFEPIARTLFCLCRAKLPALWQTWRAFGLLYSHPFCKKRRFP